MVVPEVRTGERAKVAGNLLHVSSHRAFLFGPILLTSCYVQRYQTLRAIHIRVPGEPVNEAMLEQQTAKMAEGPDPRQTRAKCEFRTSSAFEIRNKKLCTDTFYLVYCISCYLVISPPTAPGTPTAKELSNELDSVVNWYSLGIKLGVEDHELRTIEQNHRGDNERCKHEVLSRWLRRAKLPTWKAVADALHLMGEDTVAWKILSRHCISSNTTGMCPFYFF